MKQISLNSYFGMELIEEQYYELSDKNSLVNWIEKILSLSPLCVIVLKNYGDFYTEYQKYAEASLKEYMLFLEEKAIISLDNVSKSGFYYSSEDRAFTLLLNSDNTTITIDLEFKLNEKVMEYQEKGKELSNLSISELEQIKHLVHNDDYPWNVKALKIFEWVFGEPELREIKQYCNERPNRLDKLLGDAKNITLKEIGYDVNEHCGCYHHEDWFKGQRTFLTNLIKNTLKDKKISLNAKGILLFIGYHQFDRVSFYYDEELNDVNTTSEIRSFGRDIYNYTELGVNELLKVGYLETQRIHYYEFEGYSDVLIFTQELLKKYKL